MKARSAKAKGTKLEKWVVDQVRRIGASARRQPGSGIFADFKHDAWLNIEGIGNLIVECKAWRNGWRTGDSAMGVADLLVIKRNHGDPCVYMPWKTFEHFVAVILQSSEGRAAASAPDMDQHRRTLHALAIDAVTAAREAGCDIALKSCRPPA